MKEKIKLLIFDFDGVLTDNTFLLDSKGEEYVRCNRTDGLAFKTLNKLGYKSIICSTEKNNVVLARGKKLGIETFNGIEYKLVWIEKYMNSKKISPEQTMFTGNDINDFLAMNFCGYSVCPANSTYKIKKIADYVVKTNGGEGVVREIVEEIFKIDMFETLYG